MKLLLYCTKAKPYLWNNKSKKKYMEERGIEELNYITSNDITTGFTCELLNGKIVGECDFEVEEIASEKLYNGVGYEPIFYTETIDDISKKSCLTQFEIEDYLGCKAGGEIVGYAIHIKNLVIYDKPRELSDYYKRKDIPKNMRFENEVCDMCVADIECKDCVSNYWWDRIYKAPQNMMYVYDNDEKKILISIRPEWLCKILNGEKTIEVRRKVLKEMI